MTKVAALLPLKAHSSRVQGKNFKEFCGKPLFRWVFDKLLSISEIELIVINTDARSLLLQHGLEESDRVMIRDRSEEICGDEISMNKIINDDVKNVPADIYIMTHTTNPLLSKNTILNALKTFQKNIKENKADSLFTVNKIQTRFYDKNGKAINHDPKNLIPTQNLETWYEENSNLYIFTEGSFKETKARIGQQPSMYVSPLIESIDIDTPQDWDKGVLITKYLLESGQIK